MIPRGVKSFLFLILGFASVIRAFPQSPRPAAKAAAKTPTVVFIQTPVSTWTRGYAHWVTVHPELFFSESQTGGNGAGKESNSGSSQFTLRTPFLDYFGVDGRSLYANTDSSANLQFLHSLPQVPSSDPAKGKTQPSLAEYLEMFPELAPYKAGILGGKRPVLLAICKYDRPNCVQQNEALRDVKSRAAGMKIQLVEIKLLNNPPGT